MTTVDVGQDFYPRLANRDQKQGDGKHTAIEFRKRFLRELDDESAWKQLDPFIVLDFRHIRKIGPSFANEAFAYFTQYASPEMILKKIKFENLTEVQRSIIQEELEAGYSRL